jgi:hypothetical protein
MPVRGTTAYRHAIIQKKVINRDEGGWGTPTSSGTHYVMCAWSYCENDGYDMYKVRVATHEQGYEERYMNYVFCSQSHKDKWVDEWRHQMHLAEEAGRLR